MTKPDKLLGSLYTECKTTSLSAKFRKIEHV